MDPRCAPEGIGTADLADQISDFLGNPWPAGRTARFQPPERLEAVPVPARLALSVVAGRSGKRLSSSSLRPLCAGIGRGSAPSGDGSHRGRPGRPRIPRKV